MISLEICIDANTATNTRLDVQMAYIGGAATVELCTDLAAQGLTPSPGLIAVAREAFGQQRGVMVMIRPRASDFVYSPTEVALMREQIGMAAHAGADGVVFGLLTPQAYVPQAYACGTYAIDLPHLTMLTAYAKNLGLKVTFHRAFDELPIQTQPHALLDQLIDVGIDRVLTCGAALASGKRAVECGAWLADLIDYAQGRIEVVIAGGVAAATVPALLAQLPTEASAPLAARFGLHSHSGVIDPVTQRVSLAKVQQIMTCINKMP